jgi:hypothetical protein
MKLKVDQGEGWRMFNVYLNGELLKCCVEADEEEGYAVVKDWPKGTRMFLRFGTEPPEQRLTGRVQLLSSLVDPEPLLKRFVQLLPDMPLTTAQFRMLAVEALKDERKHTDAVSLLREIGEVPGEDTLTAHNEPRYGRFNPVREKP